MKRRSVLEAMVGVTGAALLAVPAVTGCSAGARLALAPWSGPPHDEGDVRLRALAYAVLAPNAHNTQPWKIGLSPDVIDLYADSSRLLPETDPPYRQCHLSQGTFLEHLVLALSALGQAAEVTYFPSGEYANDALADLPVARVALSAAEPVQDPLFSAIAGRRSNKGVYDKGRTVPATDRAALLAATGPSVTTLILDDAGQRQRLTAICADAMAAEVKARGRCTETAKWFRFSDEEMERERDGFGLAQSGRSGFTKWFLESFVVSRESAQDPEGSFSSAAIDLARDQAASAPCFGVLMSAENTRKAQVLAGRAYARVALTAALRGVAIHPMSQALEEYADMAAVKARLEHEVGMPAGSTVQMFYRLGYAPESPHTPRRDVRTMLRGT
jgi:hypothetical protein